METKKVRALLKGNSSGTNHAPKFYRKYSIRNERHNVNTKIKQYIKDIEHVDDEPLPTYIQDTVS